MERRTLMSIVEKALPSRFRLMSVIDGGNVVGSFKSGLARFEGQAFGYIDRNGEFRIQRQYADCTDFVDGIAFVRDEQGWFMIDEIGERINSKYYDDCPVYSEGVIRFNIDGRFGFCDRTGSAISGSFYSNAADFHDGLAAVVVGGRTGFIDRNGELVIPAEYDPIPKHLNLSLLDHSLREYLFSEGLASVAKDGAYGYISRENEWVVPPQFERASFLKYGIATVRVKSGMTAIRSSGDMLFSPRRIWLGLFGGGLAGFTGTAYEEYNGVIRSDGSLFIVDDGPECGEMDRRILYRGLDCSTGMIPFLRNGKWGYVDSNGYEVIPAAYDRVYDYGSREYFLVSCAGKHGLVSREGEVLIDCILDHPVMYDGGDRLAINGDGFSLLYAADSPSARQCSTNVRMSSSVEKAVSDVFELKAEFTLASDSDLFLWKNATSEGLTAYRQNGRYGFYDEEGRVSVSPRFRRVREFHSGVCCVSGRLDGPQWSFIDRSGNHLFDFESRDGADAHDDRIMVRRNGMTGYLDLQGNVAVSFKYALGNHFSEGLASVDCKGLWGFINANDEMIIDPSFESVTYGAGAKYRFAEGLSAVLIKGKYGYINKLGEIVIEPVFDKAEDFSNGGACVKTAQGYSFVDHSGRLLLPFMQEPVRRIHESLYLVDKTSDFFSGEECMMFVDGHGVKVVSSPGIDHRIVGYSAGVIPVSRPTGFGLVGFDGREIVPAVHEYIYCDTYGRDRKTGDCLILFRDNGKKGVMNQRGEILLKPVIEGRCWFNGTGLLNILDVTNHKVLIFE